MSNYLFRNAFVNENNAIYDLYKSVKGVGFCVWDEDYPNMKEILHDLETDNLFVLVCDKRIIGAISVVPENELDDFKCFKVNDGTQKEIARIVVDPAFQGRGLASVMVQGVINELSKKGYRAIHLSAVKTNIPALKTYNRLGFEIMCETKLYGGTYYLLEKLL